MPVPGPPRRMDSWGDGAVADNERACWMEAWRDAACKERIAACFRFKAPSV